MPSPENLMLRALASVLAAFCVINALFATVLTFAYRSGRLGLAEGLGRMTPGDDYRRLIPLMEAVPVWIHLIWILAAILFLASLAGVFGRARWGHLPVVAGIVLQAVADRAVRPYVAATGIVVNPNRVAEAALAFGPPAVLALVLWLAWRAEPAPQGAER